MNERRAHPAAVAGVSATVLLVGATRWGSYIGSPPLFLTDLLLAAAFIAALVRSAKYPRSSLSPEYTSSRSNTSPLLFLFVSFVIVRVGWSLTATPSIAMLVRDAAPFLYAFIAFLSAWSLSRATPAGRARTAGILRLALTFHLLWCLASIAVGGVGFNIPSLGAPLFGIRPDIDAAVLGVGAGVFLIRAAKAPRPFWPALAMILSLFGVLSVYARAGLISMVITLVFAFVFHYSSTPRRSGKRLVAQVAVPVAVIAALIIIPQTTAGERLIATLTPGAASSQAQYSAQGTENARRLVWSGVVSWVNQEPARQLFGSGFGNDFLTESGTLAFLEGSTYDNVRSPHNWFVGIYARMGTVGLLLSAGICLEVLILLWRKRASVGSDPLFATAALLFLGILPVANLGVVLEAPFGAVPFWWSIGVLYGLRSAPPTSVTVAVRGAQRRTASNRFQLAEGRRRARAVR